MADLQTQVTAMQTSIAEVLNSTIQYLPQLVMATLIVIAGWIVARVMRRIIQRIGGNINRILDRFLRSGSFANARFSTGAITLISEISFWVIVIVTLTIAARAAGLTILSTWFVELVRYIPNLLVGVSIIVAGYFISRLVGEQVKGADTHRNESIGRLTQSAILITALILGLDQIGINVTFLMVLFAVLLSAIFGGFAIAFGLGSRDLVRDLIGARTIRRQLHTGLSVRIGELEGEVLEFTSTHIAIDTSSGKVLLPGHLASTSAIIILSGNTDRIPKPDAKNE